MTINMRKLKNLFQQSVLALLLCASGVALAGPTYHVSVDTGACSGQGLMDFTFLANLGATPATAVIGNFSGAFGGEFERSPGVTGTIPGQVELSNVDGGSYLTQMVSLGGLFSFDVGFSGDFASVGNIDGTRFNVSLYNDDFSAYVGVPGAFAGFELVPPANGAPGGVLVSAPTALASVAEVPEPSAPMLVLGALALMALVRPGRNSGYAQLP